MRSSSPWFVASRKPYNVNEASSSFFFLDSWSLSIESLECKAFYIDINFIVVWIICLSLSLIYFNLIIFQFYFFYYYLIVIYLCIYIEYIF